MYIYKDGDPSDIKLSFDIKSFEKTSDDTDPHVVIDIDINSDNFNYKSVASVDYLELNELKDTLDKFTKGKLKNYCVWSHIESDIEFCFDPVLETATLKVAFVPATSHVSGFYFDLCGSDAKELFGYLNETLI